MRPGKGRTDRRLRALEAQAAVAWWPFRDTRTGTRFWVPVEDVMVVAVFRECPQWHQRLAHARSLDEDGTLGPDAIASAREVLGLSLEGYPRSLRPVA